MHTYTPLVISGKTATEALLSPNVSSHFFNCTSQKNMFCTYFLIMILQVTSGMVNPSCWTSWSATWRREGRRAGWRGRRSSGFPGKNPRTNPSSNRQQASSTGEAVLIRLQVFFTSWWDQQNNNLYNVSEKSVSVGKAISCEFAFY